MSALSIEDLGRCLLDLSQPIAKRTHCAFHLRTEASKTATQYIVRALQQRTDTPLMRHELAYILGQIQDSSVIPVLCEILRDEDDDVLVRHESAEALGNLGDETTLEILEQFSTHAAHEISETCLIAKDLIIWKLKQKDIESSAEGSAAAKGEVKKSIYLSVDPAPPIPEIKSVPELVATLMDTSRSLFHRYRAMFSLRDLNSDESAIALLAGFKDSSALFRHEVAYVLGQMQRLVTVDGLSEVLMNESEHRMVRHEAAEALGAIGGEKAEKLLSQYEHDGEEVVNQSCQVALDTMDYWSSEFIGSEGK